ncbi:MAG TPA: hypothetical protein VHG70_02270 [Nocardioidaceae bacterium]|nr:hypothetical protein [Nocardioidaceae bacterium]
MRTLRVLTAALGVGFYRFWHVPAPGASLDIEDTRRADRSVIGPVALTVLGLALWAAGRTGAAVLLDEPLTLSFEALPLTSRLLVTTGVLGVVVAVAWWVSTAPLRARVTDGVLSGCVARIPDDPPDAGEPLHAAVTELGRALRDLPEAPPQADPAFEVLQTAAALLTTVETEAPPEQRRLRRRCLSMAQQLGPASLVN